MAKRLGRFMITEFMITDHEDSLYRYFANCIILDVKHDRWKKTLEYLAISKCFRVVKDGEKIPFYMLIVTERNGKWVIGAQECDDPVKVVYMEASLLNSIKQFFKRIVGSICQMITIKRLR